MTNELFGIEPPPPVLSFAGGSLASTRADFRLVGDLLPDRRVVHLQRDLRAGRNLPRDALFEQLVDAARHVPADTAADFAAASIARRPWRRIDRLAGAFDEVADDVMHDAAVGRFQLEPAHPDVFLQVGRHGDVGIRHDDVSRHRERSDHLEDEIGLANRPAFGELRHRR
jgi:hypothetical protein